MQVQIECCGRLRMVPPMRLRRRRQWVYPVRWRNGELLGHGTCRLTKRASKLSSGSAQCRSRLMCPQPLECAAPAFRQSARSWSHVKVFAFSPGTAEWCCHPGAGHSRLLSVVFVVCRAFLSFLNGLVRQKIRVEMHRRHIPGVLLRLLEALSGTRH